jgi:hypothetical protein
VPGEIVSTRRRASSAPDGQDETGHFIIEVDGRPDEAKGGLGTFLGCRLSGDIVQRDDHLERLSAPVGQHQVEAWPVVVGASRTGEDLQDHTAVTKILHTPNPGLTPLLIV